MCTYWTPKAVLQFSTRLVHEYVYADLKKSQDLMQGMVMVINHLEFLRILTYYTTRTLCRATVFM